MSNPNDINKEFTESDWKLFRKKIVIWQENYISRLIDEYTAILTLNKDSSEKFWMLEKKLNKDKHKPGVLLEMKRSTMMISILDLLRDNVICMNDLDDFSDIFKDTIQAYVEFQSKYSYEVV